MKPKIFNSIFLLFRQILSMQFAKDKQRMKPLGAEGQIPRDGAHEACTLNTTGGPFEKEMAALVANDLGDPTAINELIKQGYVFGTLQEVIRLWHEMSLRDAGFVSKRESLANSATDDLAPPRRVDDIANALDPSDAIDFSDSADGWFKIAPYGVFRGKTPGRLQYVTEEGARAMESEFNSLIGKLGRKFRGIPIYHGHPDVDPEMWPDDRRIGKVTKVQARADGFYGYAEWNSLGEENKREGWWIYPSPRWDAPPGQTRFEPDRLISIGLTNTPRIAESDPVFNSATPDTNNDNQTNTTMDPKLIRQKVGLPPEATDEEVMAKLDSLAATANESATTASELATAKETATDLANSIQAKDAEIAKLREEQNNSLLAEAVTSGRITAAERADWEAKLNSDKRDEEINSLKAITPTRKNSALDLSDRREERATSDNLREEVANAVADLQKGGLKYTEAWSKVKKDPKFKAYFDRTEG